VIKTTSHVSWTEARADRQVRVLTSRSQYEKRSAMVSNVIPVEVDSVGSVGYFFFPYSSISDVYTE